MKPCPVIFCLLLPALAQAADDSDPSSPDNWPVEVKGFGPTPAEAEADAVSHALEKLNSSLPEEVGLFRPDADFVRRHVIDGKGQPGASEEFKLGDRTRVYRTWIHRLKPFPLDTLRAYEQREVMHQRSLQRQAWSARLLSAAALACLAALGVLHMGRRHRPAGASRSFDATLPESPKQDPGRSQLPV